MATYFGEFTVNWRALLGASTGMALGSALSHYTMSLFGPPLLAEFGWSKAQFALLGSMPLISLLLVPLAGRFTDRFGTRIAAMIGFTALPLGFIAYALMSGSIVEFFAIYVGQHIFGILTTSLVFCRVVVERFDTARGIALSVLMSAPPLIGAIAAPTLGSLIETEGWRAGYLALAAITGLGGVVAILTMGKSKHKATQHAQESHLSRGELLGLIKHPTFLLIAGGMFLVNIPQTFASSQLKLIAMDSGATSETATWMMSLYAMGVIVGRFLSGLALDRIPAHLVAIATLGLPAIGYLIFASDSTATGLLTAGVLIIGFAQGAESDVGAFLISRRFDMKNFSLLLSFVTATMGIGSAVGALILSITLRYTDSYGPFLWAAAIGTLLGAVAFGLTGSRRGRGSAASPPLEQQVAQVRAEEV